MAKKGWVGDFHKPLGVLASATARAAPAAVRTVRVL